MINIVFIFIKGILNMIFKYCILTFFIFIIEPIKGNDILLCQSKKTVLDVQCPVNTVIVFEWAQYGRQDTVTCSSQGGYVAKTDCKFPEALAILQKHCFKKTICSVEITKVFQPDPCPRTVKYLKARYSCIPESAIIPLCNSFYIKNIKSGYITSPNYPEIYDPEKICTAEIVQPSEHNTRLEILDMEVEARIHSSGCYDWLKLEEKDNIAKHYSYCGTMESSLEDPFNMTFKNAVIMFRPDQMNEYRGFLIKFEAVLDTKERNVHAKPENVKNYDKQKYANFENDKQKLENDKQLYAKLENDKNDNEHDKSTEDKIQELQQKILKLESLRKERRQRKEKGEFIQDQQPKQENDNQKINHDTCTKEFVQLPNNSYILSYKEGIRVIISCSYDYRMEDEEDGLLLCKNNSWVGEPGKCIPETCPIPDSPHNGEAIYRTLTIGSDVEFICHKGYVLYGKRSLTCLPGGYWSRFPPFCQKAGVKTLSLFGEFLVACFLAIIFVLFKHRVPRLLNGIVSICWKINKQPKIS